MVVWVKIACRTEQRRFLIQPGFCSIFVGEKRIIGDCLDCAKIDLSTESVRGRLEFVRRQEVKVRCVNEKVICESCVFSLNKRLLVCMED